VSKEEVSADLGEIEVALDLVSYMDGRCPMRENEVVQPGAIASED
jgi:hypothetical protein